MAAVAMRTAALAVICLAHASQAAFRTSLKLPDFRNQVSDLFYARDAVRTCLTRD